MAEDAFQATFLVLARKAGSLRQAERLAQWLHGVAARTAAKARVEAVRRRAHERQAARTQAVDPVNDLVWRDLRQVLDEEVSRLPARYRVPFVLCYLEGKTNAEAARLLGCPRGTIATRLARARERLRSRLARRGLAAASGALAAALSQNTAQAAVPAALTCSTAEAVCRIAAGKAAAGLASAYAVALAKGVLNAMCTSHMKIGVSVFVAVAIGAAGVGLLAHQATAGAGKGGTAQPAAKEARITTKGSTTPGGTDLVQRIYVALREDRVWKSATGKLAIWTRRVEDRRLMDVLLKLGDDHGRIVAVAACREAELSADGRGVVLLVRMREGETMSEHKNGYFRENTWPISLAALEAVPRAKAHNDDTDVEQTLLLAFGDDCKEIREASIKLRYRSRRLALAANSYTIEADGRVKFTPCRLALANPGSDRSAPPAVTTISADEVHVTLDGPFRSLANMGRRKIVAIEPVGHIRIMFRPAK
jgi:RNA polymerase sigma factor (sigma-70 family)